MGGYKADNGYTIEVVRTRYGFNNYIIRDPKGNKIYNTTSSLDDAKQYIRDIEP